MPQSMLTKKLFAGVKNVLVFDFGGGTLDVALLVLDEDTFLVCKLVRYIATLRA